MRAIDGFKACIECRRVKMVGGFHRDRTRADGRCPVCKNCVRDRHLKYSIPKAVRAETGARCCGCGSSRKVYKLNELDGQNYCGKCRIILSMCSYDQSTLDNIANTLEGKPGWIDPRK